MSYLSTFLWQLCWLKHYKDHSLTVVWKKTHLMASNVKFLYEGIFAGFKGSVVQGFSVFIFFGRIFKFKYLGKVEFWSWVGLNDPLSIFCSFFCLWWVSIVKRSPYGTLLLVTAIILCTCKYFVFVFPFRGHKKKGPLMLLIKTFSC